MPLLGHRFAALSFGLVVRLAEGGEWGAGHGEDLRADLEAGRFLSPMPSRSISMARWDWHTTLLIAELQVGRVAATEVDGVAAGAALVLEDLKRLEQQEVALGPRLTRLGVQDQRGRPNASRRDGRAAEMEIPGPRLGSQVLTQKSALSTAPSAIAVSYCSLPLALGSRAYSEGGKTPGSFSARSVVGVAAVVPQLA